MNQDDDRARETQIAAMRATMERQRETIKGLEGLEAREDAALTEIRRHLGIPADEDVVDGVKRLFRTERSRAFADFTARSTRERAEIVQLRADVEQLTAELAAPKKKLIKTKPATKTK